MPDIDVLEGGFVRLDTVNVVPGGGTKLQICSGTMIGPRLLLTAEHCVREHIESDDAWGALKTELTVSAPGGTTWETAPCQLRRLEGSGVNALPEKPGIPAKRPFNLGLKPVARLVPPTAPLALFRPVCGVATLNDPRADVAVIRLPSSAPAYPGWSKISTGIEGEAIDGYIDSKTRTVCVGYGRDGSARWESRRGSRRRGSST